jgi:hypothetical protein
MFGSFKALHTRKLGLLNSHCVEVVGEKVERALRDVVETIRVERVPPKGPPHIRGKWEQE